MKIFFDTEFTGLHKNTTLISIGLVDENGRTFYAELSDYIESQVNDWIRDNVIGHLRFHNHPYYHDTQSSVYKENKRNVAELLKDWLSIYDAVEMWSDCLAYDWVLFNDLFGDAFSIPKQVHYIPFDICTLFKIKGIDPDTQREKFAHGEYLEEMKCNKHNALWDAKVIQECYNKLMKL
jgi:hypothetical protein